MPKKNLFWLQYKFGACWKNSIGLDPHLIIFSWCLGLEKNQSELNPHRKTYSNFWLQSYYGAWVKFQLLLDRQWKKYITVSGYTTTMQRETLKISIGNIPLANSFSIFHGIGKAFDKKKRPQKWWYPNRVHAQWSKGCQHYHLIPILWQLIQVQGLSIPLKFI